MWITGKSQRHGIRLLQPQRTVFQKHSCGVPSSVHQVQPGKSFHILLGNFCQRYENLQGGRFIPIALQHKMLVTTTYLTFFDMLCINDEEQNSRQTLSVEYKLSPKTKNEKVFKELEEIDLRQVPVEYKARLKPLLEKHFSMLHESLGGMNVVEHNIQVMPEVKPQFSHRYGKTIQRNL